MKTSEAIQENSNRITKVLSSLELARVNLSMLRVGHISDSQLREAKRLIRKTDDLTRELRSGLALIFEDVDIPDSHVCDTLGDQE